MTAKDYIEAQDKNSSEVLDLVKDYSVDELVYGKENSWNVLEILEHIVITERVIGLILMRPSSKVAEGDEILGKEKLSRFIVGLGSRKLEAPETLHPKGNIKSLTEFEKALLDQRRVLKQNLESGKILINNSTYKHPFLGEMTVSDWLNFIPLHTQRHLHQITDLLKEFRKE